MNRRALLLATLLLAVPAGVMAGTSAPGVNLRWDQCYGDGGVWNKSFACNTNVGIDRLVMSFELTEPIEDVVSVLGQLTITSASPTLPAWWSLPHDGCRSEGLGYNTSLPVGSVNCTDWADGQFGNVGTFTPTGPMQPNSAAFTGGEIVKVGQFQDLVPGVEYFLITMLITRSKTVGAGACAGCATPVCILFSDLQINTIAGGRTRLTHGANYSGSAIAYWQGGYVLSVLPGYIGSTGFFFPAVVGECVPYSTTPTKPATWGAVKALYR